jgi:hypothetical protein
MSSFSERLNSPRFVRRVSWVAALVLVAGVVAFTIAYFGNTAESRETPLSNEPAVGVQALRRTVPLDTNARIVAGQFILTAVQRDVPAAKRRENLAKAWKITDPKSVVRQCDNRPCTYAQWLSGNIPVVPYPAGSVDKASFSIEESYPDQVVLQVALLPKESAEVESQIFWISLKKQKGRWLVDDWSPRVIVSVRSPGEGL